LWGSRKTSKFVIPAKAGIHFILRNSNMDPGFRRDDGIKAGHPGLAARDGG
jgi:hypothetical protein